MKKTIVTSLLMSFFTSACINTKNNDYEFIKGLNSYQKNDKISALENYKKAFEKNKNNATLTNEIAYLYADLGNYEEAKSYYKKTLALEPYNENALKNLMQLFYLERNSEEMKNYLPQILDRNSFLYNLTNLRIAILTNNKNNIETYLNKIALTNKLNDEYESTFYQDLDKISNISQNTKASAKIILEKVYQNKNIQKEQYKEILRLYSNILIENKEYEKAEEILLNYIVSNEDNSEELALLEKIYIKQNNKEKLKNLKKVIDKTKGK